MSVIQNKKVLIERVLKYLNEYQEEKNSTFKDNGTLYNLNKVFDIVENTSSKRVNIHKLEWIIPNHIPKLDIKRAKSVDTSIPLIVVETKEGLLIVDGYHRLLKAREKGLTYLPVKYITREMLETTRVKN